MHNLQTVLDTNFLSCLCLRFFTTRIAASPNGSAQRSCIGCEGSVETSEDDAVYVFKGDMREAARTFLLQLEKLPFHTNAMAGKWIVPVPGPVMNVVWTKVLTLLAEGRLGYAGGDDGDDDDGGDGECKLPDDYALILIT